MTPLETFIAERLQTLVPQYDRMELEAIVTASSFSVEFFATVNGKRMQCFQMIDAGLFSEKAFHAVSKSIADYVRKLPDFNPTGPNRYTVVLKEAMP